MTNSNQIFSLYLIVLGQVFYDLKLTIIYEFYINEPIVYPKDRLNFI